MNDNTRHLIYFGVFFIIFGLIGLSSWGMFELDRDVRELGNEYLYLAINSPDVDNAIYYLEKYKTAVEENGFTKGSCGRFFKTIDNNMSYRYDKLVRGIEFLKQLNKESGISDLSNYRAISTIPEYVKTLGVGIKDYLTANNLGRLFQFWVNLTISIFLLGIWWPLGIKLLFPESIMFS